MWYALASYDAGAVVRAALVVDARLYDLDDVCRCADSTARSLCAGGIGAVVDAWTSVTPELTRLAATVPQQIAAGVLHALPADVRLQAPYRPTRIFAAASNYREHAKEMGTRLAPRAESAPYFFMKADSSVTGPGAPVRIPRGCQKADWEVELAVILGRGGRDIAAADAAAHIAGYAILNDVSARDMTRRTDYPFTFDWFRGKSHDTFAPFGPWLVPHDCVGNAQNLRLRLEVNGVVMQDDTTASMIFTIAEQIAYLSTVVTLRAGDVIATGTPDGVGMGRGVFLTPGDVMRASIDQIGELENPVTGD